MKTNEPYSVRVKNIKSLADLEREKEKMQIEIARREEGIRYNYQNLVHLLSFRNLITTFIDEVSTTTTVISKLFSLLKEFLAKRKKKKKEKHGTPPEEQVEQNLPQP